MTPLYSSPPLSKSRCSGILDLAYCMSKSRWTEEAGSRRERDLEPKRPGLAFTAILRARRLAYNVIERFKARVLVSGAMACYSVTSRRGNNNGREACRALRPSRSLSPRIEPGLGNRSP